MGDTKMKRKNQELGRPENVGHFLGLKLGPHCPLQAWVSK